MLNRGFVYRGRIRPTDAGSTVLDHLTTRYPHTDRDSWRERIRRGSVRVDGVAVGADRVLEAGDELAWERPPWQEPGVPAGLVVLFEEPELLAVSKPAGLPTLPGGGFLEHTLARRVRERFPDAAPLHRLGRWTSGVVLFSRNPRIRAHLTRGWSAVDKIYRTRATGSPPRDRFAIDVPIGPVPHAILGSVHAASDEGRPARSRVRVIDRDDSGFLAEVVIETGRPHQIRIHLAAAGHPLAGDPLYPRGGVPDPGSCALPGDPGYLLHAHRLEFDHPARRERIRVEAPLPPELL